MRSPLSTAGFALQGAGASAVESATRGGSRFRVRLCTFSQHPHWHPLRHLSRTYFQVLGSPREPVKLLKVLNRRELARSHSTTELLPLVVIFYSTSAFGANSCCPYSPHGDNRHAGYDDIRSLGT